MAFLTVAGTTVPVSPSGCDTKVVTIGDVATRAFDGTMRSTERTTKREWSITTAPMTSTLADALVTALGTGAAISANGDVVNNVATSCFRQLTGRKAVTVKGGHRDVLTFTLLEV